jgi:FtsZ-binding cell division protein ZapB
VDVLKTFEDKIAYAVEKVKVLKEENSSLKKRINELENDIKLKDNEIEKLSTEKTSIKSQIEDLLNELETIELK